jgi:WD40 repeat protein
MTTLRSQPVFVETFEGQSFVQVLRASSVNDHVIVGSRQSVKTVSINETLNGLNTIRSMKSSSSATTAVAFHPTADSVFVSAGSNGEVSVWYYGAQNVAPLNERWAAHARAIHAMEFFPKPLTRQKSTVFPGHKEADSAMLLTAGADGELNCWDLCSYVFVKDVKWRKPALIGNLRSPGLRSGIRDIDIVFSNEYAQTYCVIVGTEDGSVEYYQSLSLNPSTLELKARMSVSTQTINSVRFEPSSTSCRFAAGGKDSYIRLFSVNTGELIPLCTIRSQGPVWALRWRPGGKYIATCQSVMDSNIYVWDLDSRLMPAYVFNSHRDNVTDLFWIDRFHLLSCSRDNSVQMHAIKNAIIPIERMRTVNISFAMLPDGSQTLTDLCAVVNRSKFEKTHADIDTELMRLGFPISEHATDFSSPGRVVRKKSPSVLFSPSTSERRLNIRPLAYKAGYTTSPAWIGRLACPLTKFVKDISLQTDSSAIGSLCELFAKQIQAIDADQLKAQGEALRLLGWLMKSVSTTSVLVLFLSKALEVFTETNDVVMVIALGAVALFSPNPALTALVKEARYVEINRSFLSVLRRLNLWQSAAEHVFHSPLSDIRSISHMRTGVNISCGNCKREQETASPVCAKCNSALSDCTLCGNRVKGLWIACEGCGHGGHLNHIDWWFGIYNVCPVPDCLHQCR